MYQKLLTKEIERKLPPLYSQENVKDPIVWVKFFHPTSYWSWYGIEYDPKERIFFGWVHGHEDELGYFSLAELESVRGPMGLGIERDMYFQPTPLSKVKSGEVRNPNYSKAQMVYSIPATKQEVLSDVELIRKTSIPKGTVKMVRGVPDRGGYNVAFWKNPIRYEITYDYIFEREHRKGHDYEYGYSPEDAIRRWKGNHFQKAMHARNIKATPLTHAVYEDNPSFGTVRGFQHFVPGPISTQNCPKCGKFLKFNESTRKFYCSKCNSTMTWDEVKKRRNPSLQWHQQQLNKYQGLRTMAIKNRNMMLNQFLAGAEMAEIASTNKAVLGNPSLQWHKKRSKFLSKVLKQSGKKMDKRAKDMLIGSLTEEKFATNQTNPTGRGYIDRRVSWYYKLPGNPYAYGPFLASSEREARKKIRNMWTTLSPKARFEVWRA